ncbi:MAG: response regulator transcription factor [Myxococcota bacterium]
MPGRILIVEDETDLARTLVYALNREGFQAAHSVTGQGGLDLAQGEPAFDLVLLDLMLPDMPGTEVCRQLRADPRTRDVLVLMLTARGEEIDRVVGFEVGTDDYLVKPFSVRELILRIRALLRRVQAATPTEGKLAWGPLRLDLDGHRCWLDGEVVPLTAVEFKLLGRLMARRGRVQTRAMLVDTVWGSESDIGERTVDATVKRLREKLGHAGAFVETLRGVGYRFVDQAEGAPS